MTSVYIFIGVLLLAVVLLWSKVCTLDKRVNSLLALNERALKENQCKHIRLTFTDTERGPTTRVCGDCGIRA